jgi:hypothetical protein
MEAEWADLPLENSRKKKSGGGRGGDLKSRPSRANAERNSPDQVRNCHHEHLESNREMLAARDC